MVKSDIKKDVHSRLGASSAYRWFACPGSIRLCSTVPAKPSSSYAELGTAAHKLAELCLMLECNAQDLIDSKIDDYFVDADMADAVQLYLDTVLSYSKAEKDTVSGFEKRFHLKQIDEEAFGTNDFFAYQVHKRHLVIVDYKHGQGHPVDAENNKQLMYYALGALQDYPKCETVELVIVQPRAPHREGPVRKWTISREQLDAFGEELKEAIARTRQPNAPLDAGDHCKFCAAQPICPELHKKALEVAKAAFDPITESYMLPEPTALTTQDIKRVLDSASMFDGWLRSVEKYAESLAVAGQKLPGYKLVRKKTNRSWADSEKAQEVLYKEFGDEILTEPQLLSVSQAEKAIKRLLKDKEAVEEILAPLVHKPIGDVTLASEDDKRPEVLSNEVLAGTFTEITDDSELNNFF
jgi:hypothetical protein